MLLRRLRTGGALAVLLAIAFLRSGPADGAAATRVFVAPVTDPANSVALRGQALVGRVVLTLKPAVALRHVRYLVDGQLRRPAPRAPYVLPVDLTAFESGMHTIAVTYRQANANHVLRTTFRVQNLVVSPTGSGGGPCTQASPCGSWDRAYHLARPGQVVELVGGTYQHQAISADARKQEADSNVVFRPAPGQQITVQDELEIQGSHVEFRDLAIGGDWEIDPNGSQPTSFVTLRDVDATNFYINSSTDIDVLGGKLGPTTNLNSQIKALDGGVQPARILIQGVWFHDYVRTDPNVHMECLQVLSAAGITIRGNRFQRCAIMDLYFSQFGSAGATHDVLVENNFFDGPTAGGFYAVNVAAQLGVPPTNFTFRYNSSLDTMYVDTTAGVDGVSFVANVGPRAQYNCPAGVRFAYNVWDQAKCGPTDLRAPLGFKDPQDLDLDLVPGAAAINHGDPSSYPRYDIHGTLRPLGRRPDAGADEAR